MFRPRRSPIIRKTDKMTSFITVLWRFVLFSSAFWVLFSIIGFFLLYDPSFGENSSLYFFSSFHLSLQFIGTLLIIFVFSAILGALLSIPAIILKIIMKIRLDKKSRKGQKPVIFIYSSAYLPIIFCIFLHLSALLMSTAVAPQLMRNWIQSDLIIYEMQEKIYKELFEIPNTEIYYSWNKIAKNLAKDSKFIFVLPEHLLTYKDSFIETKSLLKKEDNWLLFLSTKEAIAASLLHEANFTDEKLYLPAPLQVLPRNELNFANDAIRQKIVKTKNFIGINGKNTFNFTYIFHKDSVSNTLPASWFSVFLNRIALSQPQLLLFFRLGLSGALFPAWKWEKITNINSHLLWLYINKLKNIKEEKSNFVFFLTEMEIKRENSFLDAIDWPDVIPKYEFEENIKKIDNYLASAIKALQDSGHDNIIVIPYSQKSNYVGYGKGFSSIDFTKKLLTTEIVNQVFIQNSSSLSCTAISLSYNLNDKKQRAHQKNYFLLDTINSKFNQYPFIKREFLLAVKDELRYAVLCQDQKKPTYLTIKKDDLFNKGIYNNKIAYRNLSSQLFSSSEKKQKKADTDSQNVTRKDPNLYEFFRQFDVYKINIDPIQPYSAISDLEKEQFIKNYGQEVRNTLYSYVQLAIK